MLICSFAIGFLLFASTHEWKPSLTATTTVAEKKLGTFAVTIATALTMLLVCIHGAYLAWWTMHFLPALREFGSQQLGFLRPVAAKIKRRITRDGVEMQETEPEAKVHASSHMHTHTRTLTHACTHALAHPYSHA